MKVTEFVNEFKNKKIQNTQIAPNAVSEYIKKILEVKDYISFAEKRELCASVIDASCNKKNGIVTVDSVSRYILFTVTILTKYTNLEFNTDEEMDSLDEYDLLCREGLLDEILDVIGQEYVKCNNLLNMMLQDVIDNNNTIEAVLAGFSNDIVERIGDITDALSYKINEMNLDLSQIDIDKIMPLLDKIGGLGK